MKHVFVQRPLKDPEKSKVQVEGILLGFSSHA